MICVEQPLKLFLTVISIIASLYAVYKTQSLSKEMMKYDRIKRSLKRNKRKPELKTK